MEEIIIDLLVLLVGFGPIMLAFKHQEWKEKEEYERGRRMIKTMSEKVKNNNK